MLKYFIIFLLIIPIFSQSQGTSKNSATIQPKPIVQKDTIVIYQKIADEKIEKNYQEILEKTNSQLSLWWNPYGILIAILGVLFALLAIIASYLFYRQSKEHKELIKESLSKHEIELNELKIESNNQLENDKMRLDNLILDYKEKLNTAGDESKKEIYEFISKLEEQKVFIDTKIHTYIHSGFQYKDIPCDYPIGIHSIFYARITLNQEYQSFVIYFRVVTIQNKKYWLGFAGGKKSKLHKEKNESTLHQIYNKKEIIINENITSIFERSFLDGTNNQPIYIDCVRLRGSDTDMKEITFSYKIID
ncbi:MAG: hypothetical protein HZB41_14650 [Ignavibacteriae bacterium]|nr:hypothetical protein [Ignavibacteriota bacterium]